jgi:drug/metabolite transporter (DMT)-like permease
MTMAIGGVPYVALTFPQFLDLDWSSVSAFTWISLVLSALLALNVAYLIWYTGVQKIGAARTSMFSNLVPLVAMSFAAVWLGEPLIVGETHRRDGGADGRLPYAPGQKAFSCAY